MDQTPNALRGGPAVRWSRVQEAQRLLGDHERAFVDECAGWAQCVYCRHTWPVDQLRLVRQEWDRTIWLLYCADPECDSSALVRARPSQA